MKYNLKSSMFAFNSIFPSIFNLCFCLQCYIFCMQNNGAQLCTKGPCPEMLGKFPFELKNLKTLKLINVTKHFIYFHLSRKNEHFSEFRLRRWGSLLPMSAHIPIQTSEKYCHMCLQCQL